MITLEDLERMGPADLHGVLVAGGALSPDALAGTRYLGVDLSLPGWARGLLWRTFCKTFHRDAADGPGGPVRGWNVRIEQRGTAPGTPIVPLRDRHGRPRTFGHYRVLPADGLRFPRGWRGSHYLDYRVAGNRRTDPAALGFCPLVAVNPGRMDLLLGWELFRLGPVFLPLPRPLYWALRLDGPLGADEVVAPPRGPGAR